MSSVEAVLALANRREWARVLAATVRVTHDLDAAEDAVQEAFATAVQAWREHGLPPNPGGWLTTTARRKALDRLRRERALADRLPLLAVPAAADPEPAELAPSPEDDRLRLIFLCCHPALSPASRVALTLRYVCGLATPEVARLLLAAEPTMAARLTRAKKKIRAAGIPFRIPDPDEYSDRLPDVLAVVYLLHTEGHTATRGDRLSRVELTARALELARLVAALMPEEPEVLGLLGLLRLNEARAPARTDENGRPILLEHQDRSRWDRAAIREGIALVGRALRGGGGPYSLQAAIAAVHAEAGSYSQTDWPQILALYDELLARHPSPTAAVGRAVALAEVDGPETGLVEIERLAADPALAGYYPVLAARAELLRRLGRAAEARAAFTRAAERASNPVEAEFLRRRAGEDTAEDSHAT